MNGPSSILAALPSQVCLPTPEVSQKLAAPTSEVSFQVISCRGPETLAQQRSCLYHLLVCPTGYCKAATSSVALLLAVQGLSSNAELHVRVLEHDQNAENPLTALLDHGGMPEFTSAS